MGVLSTTRKPKKNNKNKKPRPERPTVTNELTKDCNDTVTGNIENESEKNSRFHSSDIVINFAPSLTNTVSDVGNRGVENEKSEKLENQDDKLTEEDEHYRRMIDMILRKKKKTPEDTRKRFRILKSLFELTQL